MSSRGARSHIASAAVFLADFRGKMKICFDIFLPNHPSLSLSLSPLIPPFIFTSVSQPRRDVGPRG